jgi:hypothetical protein
VKCGHLLATSIFIVSSRRFVDLHSRLSPDYVISTIYIAEPAFGNDQSRRIGNFLTIESPIWGKLEP